MKTEINIDGIVYVPKENQPVKPVGIRYYIIVSIVASIFVFVFAFLLYISGFLGGYIEQGIWQASDGEIYLRTIATYNDKTIFLELDEIKIITPEFKKRRLEQAEKLLQTVNN